ncbi:signal peptidase I [Agromyces larvae]|uniref:Signal peptidase I n=1 Tax=Agromyces larvae TaxID=2929802 RepID=A0ABY4BYK3_9MICO|nr:signal peptidase I [Agromyces larvae]UOE43814.1 signal peptidase I [Agromyces larvae]
MTVLRRIGGILSWVLAAVGVLAGALWIATSAGLVQPLIVVSGSMEPGIRVGDLLIAVPEAADDVEPGSIATLPNPQTGTLVTHRVLEVAPVDDGYEITMQGDANGVADPVPYRVAADASVWHPALVLPGVGTVFDRIARPGVAVPLLVTVGALMLLAALPGGRARGRHAFGTDADTAEATEPATEPAPPGTPPEPAIMPKEEIRR